jgi:hypothetical protein
VEFTPHSFSKELTGTTIHAKSEVLVMWQRGMNSKVLLEFGPMIRANVLLL